MLYSTVIENNLHRPYFVVLCESLYDFVLFLLLHIRLQYHASRKLLPMRFFENFPKR